MRRLLAIMVLALALPAGAQNAGQIARVQAGASCPRCNLFQADLTGKTLARRNFAGARLRQADLSLGTFTGSRFAGADLRDLNGYGALFGHADLRGADLTHASLVGAYLEHADFTRAKLVGVNLSGAELSTARGLTPSQLAEACGDGSTRLPRGLQLRPC
jgi:uncharacterized protein YjbI with pentapeptide repeats